MKTDSISRQTKSNNDELQFIIGKDGVPRLSVSVEAVPEFLVKAKEVLSAGRIDEAAALLNDQNIELLWQMVRENRCRVDVMFLLAMTFYSLKDWQNSEIWFKEVLKYHPHALVYHELGRICKLTGRVSEAMEYRKKAMDADPDNPKICCGYAKDIIRVGQNQQGIDLLRKAVEKAPDDPLMHSKLLFCLHYLPDLDPQMLFEEHKRWGQIHTPISLAKTSHNNVAEPDRKLRVGYISPDFRRHSVSYFFESLLDGHNREVIEVYGYGNIGLPDEVTERLKSKFDHYRDIRSLKDKVVVDMVERDKIDILVELAGHTPDNRLLVLAHKPAPVQVTYLGAPDTTGMQAIDYRFTDLLADTPQSQQFYTEELYFLPKGFLCYRPADFTPLVAALPASRNGYITFGSFNNSGKIHRHIIELWGQILRANDNSRLLMKFRSGYDQGVRDYYFSQFEQVGISRERVQIHGWKSSAEHLQLYNQVDITLDTYPWNGYTTTCETLWMGVPAVSLVGKHHVSRVGLSILSQLGLEFFAASTPEEYVAKATALAQNLESLARIRASMRQRMAASTLCDAKTFTKGIEAAYRKMWHKWCRAQGVDVSSERIDTDRLTQAVSLEEA